MNSPIGIFDSGFGGLSILDKIRKRLPWYDYIYLGDNARAPYGNRSFEVVYKYTLQAVEWLFGNNCPIVILACNTASAKALRNVQQKNLPLIDPEKRVLGVIRPTVECIGEITKTRHIGILGTTGTIASDSYPIEIKKLFPDVVVESEACPMWVHLVENDEHDNPGADYFVRQHINNIFKKDPEIDTIILACTHYPLLIKKIISCLPESIQLVSQGVLVAESLENYLFRHPEMEIRCSKNSSCHFYTTDSKEKFEFMASRFLNEEIKVERINLE